jgi:hypothetical protein
MGSAYLLARGLERHIIIGNDKRLRKAGVILQTALVFPEEVLLFRVGICYGRFVLGAPRVTGWAPKAGNSGETFTGLLQRTEVYCPLAWVVGSRVARPD